jgi:hypothetical protein
MKKQPLEIPHETPYFTQSRRPLSCIVDNHLDGRTYFVEVIKGRWMSNCTGWHS